jgi:hypothetical protein
MLDRLQIGPVLLEQVERHGPTCVLAMVPYDPYRQATSRELQARPLAHAR